MDEFEDIMVEEEDQVPGCYGCDCPYEPRSIECVGCLKDFVKQYNEDYPDEQLEVCGGAPVIDFYINIKLAPKIEGKNNG